LEGDSCGLFQGTLQAFGWIDWGKPWKT